MRLVEWNMSTAKEQIRNNAVRKICVVPCSHYFFLDERDKYCVKFDSVFACEALLKTSYTNDAKNVTRTFSSVDIAIDSLIKEGVVSSKADDILDTRH